MWFINLDGKAAYNKFYREPGARKRALAILGQAASVYGAVAGQVGIGINGTKAAGNIFAGSIDDVNKNMRSTVNSY